MRDFAPHYRRLDLDNRYAEICTGKFVWRSVMGSYKRPRVFNPLDEAALAQILACDPLFDPMKEAER
jgi:hypothetical protein